MADADAASEPDGELITPEVSAELVAALVDMGFSANRAARALYHTGTDSVEVAVNWATEHAEDADADEPLLVPKNKIVRARARLLLRLRLRGLRGALGLTRPLPRLPRRRSPS